jgi:chromate transport protein ChrA
VGYAAAGVPGAVLATSGLYLPSFVAVLSVAPHMARLREAPASKRPSMACPLSSPARSWASR